ncbi:MAG: hypothetical protein V3T86_08440 [Planctomycetota bacterium]
MRLQQLLAPSFALATVLLMGTNAIPASQRKRILIEERGRLVREYTAACKRGKELRAELQALRDDPFVLESWLLDTWKGLPSGATPWDESADELKQADRLEE